MYSRICIFDGLVDMVVYLSMGTLIGKTIISSVFRSIPIYPRDFDLSGFSVDG